MKNLANCTPTEFMKQCVKLRGPFMAWLDKTGISEIRKRKPEGYDSMSDEEKNAWAVIGAVNGTMWDTDFPMVKEGDVWKSVDAFTMEAGTEFKVRQGKSWDVSVGAPDGSNFKVEEAGTYFVTFDEATGTIALVAE